MNETSHQRSLAAPLRQRLLELRVLLITGKGGVGRTTVAAASALVAARAGRQVLLAEVGEPDAGHSHLGRQFGHEQLSAEPRDAAPGLQLCTLSARQGHELFLRAVLPVPALARAALRSKAVRKFLDAVPSFHEMGIFYHLLSLLRQQGGDGQPLHELVIIDMPASGHTLAMTGLPVTLLRLIPEGPISRELQAGIEYLNDPVQSAAWVVTLPEVLPVTECLELIEGLAQTRMPVGGVVLNRLPEDPFSTEERAALEVLLAHSPTLGQLAFERIAGTRQALGRLVGSIDLPLAVIKEFSRRGADLLEDIAADILHQRERV